MVLGVRNVPVDGREVLTLSKLLVKPMNITCEHDEHKERSSTRLPPEHLDNGERGCGHRVGEISTGRGHGTHNSDGTKSLRRTKAVDFAGALIKVGQPSTWIHTYSVSTTATRVLLAGT